MTGDDLTGGVTSDVTDDVTDDDAGSAIIEFVFVAIVVMLPLLYLITAVAAVQRSQLAVADAAREAGRAFATADRRSQAMPRVETAVRLALDDENLTGVQVRFVRSSCAGPAITPRLSAGAVFTVCVSRRVELPGLPSLFTGKGITSQGKYVVHVDDYRATP